MLITQEEVYTHLRLSISESSIFDEEKADILLKSQTAQELVLKYLGKKEEDFVDVPFYVKSAILIYTGILYNNREGEVSENLSYGQLPRSVTNLLIQYRNCSIA